jgi:hypothetical protein
VFHPVFIAFRYKILSTNSLPRFILVHDVVFQVQYNVHYSFGTGALLDMQTKQQSLFIQAVHNVLIVVAIYLSIWLSGLQDTARRWTLLICLFAVWGAFLLGRSSGQRHVASPGWAWGFVALLIMAVGLLLRFSA